MGIITETVEVKPTGKMIQYYKDKGYDAKYCRPLIVSVEDLPKNSHVVVEVLCDICNKNTLYTKYQDYNDSMGKTGSYACRDCSYVKSQKTNQERYGASALTQTEHFKEKAKQTNLERYGVENYSQTKERQEKFKKTCLEKYGVENPNQSEEIKNKIMITNLERYGVKSTSQVKEIKEKQIKTLYNNYGVISPMHSPIIKEKMSKTLYKNGTRIASKQQRYLHNLLGGELNYSVKFYDVDICFQEEKIIVEYDGSGHDLPVKFGKLTKEEFNQKEIARFNVIKREGYKQMRIMSAKDLLPLDEILLQMLAMAKEYFSKTSHSWINFDIDNSIMINAENKDIGGVFFDYGILRRIKESA